MWYLHVSLCLSEVIEMPYSVPEISKEIIIDVAKVVTPILGSRDVVKYLEQKMDRSENIILDFRNVEFISRSAAHSLLNYKMSHPDKKIDFINMNSSVSRMLEIVESQLNSRKEGIKMKESK